MLTEKLSSSTEDVFTSKLLCGIRSLLAGDFHELSRILGPGPRSLDFSTLFQTVGRLYSPPSLFRDGYSVLM